MGYFVAATCPCGCRGDLTVGAGMADFTESAYAPAGCTTCAAVVDVDVMAGEARCPDCGGDVTLFARIVARPTADDEHDGRLSGGLDWQLSDDETLVVGPGPWPCPACGSPTLRIGIAGIFD